MLMVVLTALPTTILQVDFVQVAIPINLTQNQFQIMEVVYQEIQVQSSHLYQEGQEVKVMMEEKM